MKHFFTHACAFVLLTSCQTSCQSPTATNIRAQKKINLFIWGEYTSADVIESFHKKTGISVIESHFSSNEEMLAKIQTGAGGYDLIVPSDYMVAVMKNLEILAPLDKSKIPNFKHVQPELLNQPYDPGNLYSTPYAWSLVGIVTNTEKAISPVTSHGELFSRPDLAYRFSVLDDSRETIASVLKSRGLSANTTDSHQLEQVQETLFKVKNKCREFNSAPTSQLLHGDLIAAQIYSNEALKLSQKSPKFHFAIPTDGFTMAIDNMVIPRGAKNPNLAYELINYLLDPDVNLKVATDVLIPPIISGVYEKLPKDLQKLRAMGPLDRIKGKAEMIIDVGEFTKKYDRLWTELKVSHQ